MDITQKSAPAELPIKLLIVDDDDMVRLFLKKTLKDPDYQVAEAADGEEALALLAEDNYAVVIVDLNMPGMNGEQLIKQIRAHDKFIGLIVLTSETNIDVSFRLLEQYDISDYLMKPMFKELQLQLRFSVKNALNRRRFLYRQDRHISNLEYLRHQAEEAKSNFLTQMNHELNTPMNVILGFGQLLDNMEEGLAPKQKGYVKQIINAGWTLMGMIEKILKLSSIESDGLNLNLVNVQVDDVVNEVIRHLTPQAQKNNITLLGQSSNLSVTADIVQLRAVIFSLVNNGIIYNQEGGEVTVTCEISDDNRIKIEVNDTGTGIAKEKLKELFTPFNRLGIELKTISGAGVSLALAQRLVEAMNGRIGCFSKVDLGSVFWIELPR
jgi:signal transduction histidine kinase